MSNKSYITTPIYYVNARPHIGHAYTTIVGDTLARRQRMLGIDTFFLTGTDEHGQKIERSAAVAGRTLQEFTDEVSAQFRRLWDRMGITYDAFIRTTELHHIAGVQEMFRRIRDNGHIYKGQYTGQYCVSDELYVNDASPGAPCPDCGRPTETISEENYYFRLSSFTERLLQHYERHSGFIFPETRRNEVTSFVKSGLKDLSISRTNLKWGVPVPDDPDHVLYVWFDAVCNYITAIGFGSSNAADKERLARYWPADIHLVGKEIIRFHAVYWPAFLMAAELEVPKSVVAHGWLLFEEDKISKSRGNAVRVEPIIDALGCDALRYFLLRETVFGQDGSFSFDALVTRYNADLANDLGNLASRTLTMIAKYFDGYVPDPPKNLVHGAEEQSLTRLAGEVIEKFQTQFHEYQFSRALETAWTLVAAVNKYIVESLPWKLAENSDEESRSRLATILYTSSEALRIITVLVHPIMPDATAKIWSQLGLGEISEFDLNGLKWGQPRGDTKLGEIKAVFPRAPKEVIEQLQNPKDVAKQSDAGGAQSVGQGPIASARPVNAEANSSASRITAAPDPKSVAVPSDNRIAVEDFAKVDLRVGEIKFAEKVKNADKLLRLEVDIGTETRQILAGIAEFYDPATLVGRKVIVVANLAPRKLRGLESNGMIVAASVGEKGSPVLAGFLEEVPAGARLK